MKRGISFVVLVLVFTAVPASAQNAQYCYGYPTTCQYLADNGMELGSSYWSYDFGSGQSTVADPCAWGGGNTGAADLEPGDSVMQEFDTDNFSVWTLRLDLYKTSTNVTADDYFVIYVRNFRTMQVESFFVSAADYSGLCGSVISFNLANNYSDAHVRVRIQKGHYSTTPMYVDNVAFFGRAF